SHRAGQAWEPPRKRRRCPPSIARKGARALSNRRSRGAAAGAVPGNHAPAYAGGLRHPTIAGAVFSTVCGLRRVLACSIQEADILRVLRPARRRGAGELGGEEVASLGLPSPGGEPALSGAHARGAE